MLIIILILSVFVCYLFVLGGVYVVVMVLVFVIVGKVVGVLVELLVLGLLFFNFYGGFVMYYGGGLGLIIFGVGYNDIKFWWIVGVVVVFGSLIIYVILGFVWWEYFFSVGILFLVN